LYFSLLSHSKTEHGQKRASSAVGGVAVSDSGTTDNNDVHSLSSEAGSSNTANRKNSEKYVTCNYRRQSEGPATIFMKSGNNYISFPITEVDDILQTLAKYAEWNTPKKLKIAEN
jgi:hypothetical protein